MESTSSLTLLPAIPTFRTTLASGISSLAREQDNTGTLAVTAQAPALAWGGHWAVQQSQPDYYIMEISGLIQPRSYDARTASSSALTRAIMAPQYVTSLPYSSSSSSASLVAPQHPMQQHHQFNTAQYAGAGSNSLVPAFNSNYIQQRPQVRMISSSAGLSRTLSYPGSSRQSGFVEEQQSPTIKSESPALSSNGATWNMHTPTTAAYTSTDKPPVPSSGEVGFRTEVDTLMKAIQSKVGQQPSGKPPQSAPIEQSKPAVGSLACVYVSPAGTSHGFLPEKEGKEQKQRLTEWDSQDEKPTSKKRYECEIPGCNKSFYQKTHLEIHIRAHTGVKPYACKTQGCNQRFSQLGNLKTHERRHTGERPYHCEICGKRFAQRGNVRAHKIVHDQAKPFVCRLEDCGKQFTQLGNLKSHQNKFHGPALRNLTSKFASFREGDAVSPADKELWEYFATLYKNSNKGIKGRGKDRKVGSSSSQAPASGMNVLTSRNSISMGGVVGSNVAISMNAGSALSGQGMQVEGREGSHTSTAYEMYDVEEGTGSVTESQGSGSSTASLYGVDAPSDTYDAEGRELTFRDQIY